MRKTITGVSLAAFLALGAVGCGSGSSSSAASGVLDPSSGPSAAASATTSASPSTSPSTSPSASTAAVNGVQQFPFPSGVKIVFQTPLPASGLKRGAMIGYENYVESSWYAIQTHGRSTAYEKYGSGNVLTGAAALIDEFVSHHWTLHGTITYYDMSVPQSFGTAGAVVQACVDTTHFSVLGSNGKVAGSVFQSQWYHYQEQSSAGKTHAGYWTIVHTISTSSDKGGSAGMCV